MYADIGKKIKGLAKWTFIVEAIGAVVGGISLMVIDEYLIIYGILIMLLGPFAAWASSWVLFGFGEIVDKTIEIARNTSNGKVIKSESQIKTENKKVSRLEELRTAGLITEEEYQKAVSNMQ